MGYYSQLTVRLTEAGYRPGTVAFLRQAKLFEAEDCRVLKMVRVCAECGELGTPGCVWGERGDQAHGPVELKAVSGSSHPQRPGVKFVVVDRVWGDRFDCADEVDRDTALACIQRRARAGQYQADFVVSAVT